MNAVIICIIVFACYMEDTYAATLNIEELRIKVRRICCDGTPFKEFRRIKSHPPLAKGLGWHESWSPPSNLYQTMRNEEDYAEPVYKAVGSGIFGRRSLSTKPETDLTLSTRGDDIGDNNNPNDIPSLSESRAKSFIPNKRWFFYDTLSEYCCGPTTYCPNEVLREGSQQTSVELGEECLQEGCSDEEIEEHC